MRFRLLLLLFICLPSLLIASETPDYRQEHEFKKRDEPKKEEGFIPKEKAEEISANESYLLEKQERINFFRNKSNLRNYRIRKLQKELEGKQTEPELEEQLKKIKSRETDAEKENRLKKQQQKREKLLSEEERYREETVLKEALKEQQIANFELLLINGFDTKPVLLEVTPIDELIKVRADEFPSFRKNTFSPSQSLTPPTLQYLRNISFRKSIRGLFKDQEDQSGYSRFMKNKK